jgi:CBS domain-containing protein
MANHGIGRLPVVDPADPTKVLGIVTRSDLLKARARAHEEETRTERFLIQGLVARLDPLRRGGG